MEFFKKIFRRRKQFKPQPKQLRIDGVKTTLTPTPDDAELAAQALLESRLSPGPSLRGRGVNSSTAKKADGKGDYSPPSQGGAGGESVHDAQYYRNLSEKIRAAHEADKHAAMRYVAYCEQQLALMDNGKWKMENSNSDDSSLFTLHSSLYKYQDAVEREGGKLLKRWQHCLAEVIVRQMAHTEGTEKTTTDLTDDADEHQPSDI